MPCSKLLVINSAFGKYDPTKTTGLRLKFIRDIKRRFKKLSRQIQEAIVDKDVLGLNKPTTNVSQYQFAFARTDEKINAFMDWIKDLERQNILQVKSTLGTRKGLSPAWSDKYIDLAYKQGVTRAQAEMRKAGIQVPDFPLSFSFQQKIHIDSLGAIYTRMFSELEGITAQMDLQISRILADGLLKGQGAKEIAKQMANTVEGMGISRATTIARTEIIRSHHLANMNEYAQYEMEGVKVQAEWNGVDDHRRCERCESNEGKIYTLEEITPLIPLHPNCRCMALPVL